MRQPKFSFRKIFSRPVFFALINLAGLLVLLALDDSKALGAVYHRYTFAGEGHVTMLEAMAWRWHLILTHRSKLPDQDQDQASGVQA